MVMSRHAAGDPEGGAANRLAIRVSHVEDPVMHPVDNNGLQVTLVAHAEVTRAGEP